MDYLVQIIVSGCGVALITGLFNLLHARDQKKTKQKELDYSNTHSAVETLTTMLTDFIASTDDRFNSLEKQLMIVKDDNADLLCDRLNQAYNYHMAKGYCSPDNKKLVNVLWQRYKGLKRNHLTDLNMNKIFNLPDHEKVRV